MPDLDNVRSITEARSAPHRVSKPLPGWLAKLWAAFRGYGGLWLEPCDRCGKRALMHYAPTSVFNCLRFRPIRVTQQHSQERRYGG